MAAKVTQDPRAYLKSLGSKWKGAAKEGKARRAGSKFVDGMYEGRVTKAVIRPSAKGQMQIVYDLLFVNGDYAGETLQKFAGMDFEDALVYIAQDLSAFEIDPEDIVAEDIADAIEEIDSAKPYLQFRLHTGAKGYQNCYFNKMLDADEVEDTVGDNVADIEEGSRVTFVKNKKEGAGEVKTLVDDTTVKIKTDEGKLVTLNIEDNEVKLEEAETPDTDEDEDATEPEEGELAEGQKVKYTFKGETKQGIILELLEDEGKVRIDEHDEDWDSTGTKHKVKAENVAIIPDNEESEEDDDSDDTEDDEEEETPAKKPAAGKKTVSKPTAKPGRK